MGDLSSGRPMPGAHPGGLVQVRLVREDDGVAVLDWENAQEQEDRTWSHSIERVPTGGLYRIESRLVLDEAPAEWGAHGDVIHHIGVGDLWIIAGQSNAAGYGRGPVDDPSRLGVHILKNNERWDIAAHPLNDPTGSTHANTEIANPGHSPYLAFAKHLQRESGLPDRPGADGTGQFGAVAVESGREPGGPAIPQPSSLRAPGRRTGAGNALVSG